MAFDEQVAKDIRAAAQTMGLEPEAMLALVEVESGGKAYTRIGDKDLPLIRWEGHYFYKLLPGDKRAEAVRRGLAAERYGIVKNTNTQSGRYAMLERAKAIDEDAALASCSWGVGQVMGANWEWLGYPSVKALVEEAMSGIRGQVLLMVRFIDKAGLRDELQRHDWAGFARRYNGPSYRAFKYDERMRRAYERTTGGKKTESAPDNAILKVGSAGEPVVILQRKLRGLGYHLVVDGDFGPGTRNAVVHFQKEHGLKPDGIVGPRTAAVIDALSGVGVAEENL
jgi:hypothetical protein